MIRVSAQNLSHSQNQIVVILQWRRSDHVVTKKCFEAACQDYLASFRLLPGFVPVSFRESLRSFFSLLQQ